MNTSNFSHALLALIALIYIATGNLWYGAVFGIAFYLGREVAQQEAHTIAGKWVSLVSDGTNWIVMQGN